MCGEGNCFVLSPRWCQVSNEVLFRLPPSRAGSGSRKWCWGPGGAAEFPVTWGKSAAFCFFDVFFQKTSECILREETSPPACSE